MHSFTGQDNFADLFRREYASLYRLAFSLVKDEAVAQDIVQDFFIDYWQRRQGKIEGRFEAYASRAIRNACISYFRRKVSNEKHIDQYTVETFQESDADAGSVDKDLMRIKVFKAIDLLPPERKKVLLLSAKEGLSNRQIADLLGISIHTVNGQLVKAYGFIRKEVFKDKLGEDDFNLDQLILIIILSSYLSVS